MKYRNLIATLGLLTAAAAHAQSPAPTAAAPPEHNWRLGIALGVGERTNPIVFSDNIPLYVDLDIAWFGKRWFFDNGDLGFALLDNDRFTTNLVARVNSDRVFFGKTNTRYITLTSLGGGNFGPAVDPQTGAQITNPLPLKPPQRSYAIELGLETLVDGDWGAATFRAFHDVSGAHNGYEITADYEYRVTRGRLSLTPSVGLGYKSDALADYYWGVHADEANLVLPQYRAEGGLGWQAGLRANYYLTKQIRVAVSTNYERLEQSIAGSPLVNDPYVFGYFAGVAWQF